MSKPTQASKAPTATKAPAKTPPTPASAGASAIAELSAGAFEINGASSLQGQADRLGNARLHAAQRQLLAAKIGQQQGNGHLQQVVAFLKQDDKTDYYKPINEHRHRGFSTLPTDGGLPLPAESKASFEQALGYPLDHVRTHTGDDTNRSTQQLGAEAFTVGSDVYFAEGNYDPGTPEGDRLLGHELVHVIQHGQGRVPRPASTQDMVSSPADTLEVEAYTRENIIAQRVAEVRGDPAVNLPAPSISPVSTVSPVLSRQEDDLNSLIATNGAQESPQTEVADEQLIPALPDQEPSPIVALLGASAGPLETSVDLSKPPVPPSATTPVPTEANTAPNQVASAPAANATNGAAMVASTAELPPPEIATPTDGEAIKVEQWPQPPTLPETGSTTNLVASGQAAEGIAALEVETQALAENLATAASDKLTALDAEVARLVEAAYARTEQARATVTTAHTTEKEAISAEVEATIAVITQSRDQQLATIQSHAETERQQWHDVHQAKRESATSYVAQLKGEITAHGEIEAQRALAESEQRAQAVLTQGRAVNITGDAPSAEAQSKGAGQIAEHTAQICNETGIDLANRVRLEATQFNTNEYDTTLQSYLAQLDQIVADTLQPVDQWVSSTTSEVNSLAEQAVTAAQEMGRQSNAALESAQTAALAEIDTWESQAVDALTESGAQVRTSMIGEITGLQENLIQYGSSAAAQLSAVQQPEGAATENMVEIARQDIRGSHAAALAGLDEWFGQTLNGFNSTFDDFNGQLGAQTDEQCTQAAEMGAQLVQSLQEGGENARTGMEGATTAFQTELTTMLGTTLAEIENADAQFQSQLQQPQQVALNSLTQLVDEGLASEDQMIADAQSQTTSAVGQIANKYEELSSEAEQRSSAEQELPAARIHRSILGSITQFWHDLTEPVRKWFADTFGDFWGGLIYSILETIVLIVAGAVILWAVGAAIAAALAAIGIAVKATVVALVIGLLIAIPLLVWNRFEEYKADHKGQGAEGWAAVGLVGLGILDITGIPYIIEGVAGQRATGGELEGWDRGARIGTGVVMFAAAAFAAYRFFKPSAKPGVRPGAPSEPVEPVRPVEPEVPVDPVEPKVPVDPALIARRGGVFDRALEINRRAAKIGEEFGKSNDPELNKIREAGDEIVTEVHQAEPEKLDAFEQTLKENAKRLDEIEGIFGEEVNLKIQRLTDLAGRLKERAYEVADRAGEHENSDLAKIALESERIESELKQSTPGPETLERHEYTLAELNKRLREIEVELGLESPFTYIEEFEPGRYRLKPEYAENWRSRFYECDYSPETYAEIEHLRTTPREQGGWAHESDPNLIWDEVLGEYVDARLPQNTITVDHTPQAVVEHWKSGGNNMSQAGRQAFFRDSANHKVVLQRYNSAGGGKLKGQFRSEVGSDFSGPGGKK